LGEDLPEFLSAGRVRTPAIAVLFLILIGEHRLKGSPVQVKAHHISRGKRADGQSGKEQFVDHLVSGFTHRGGVGRGGMGSHDHPADVSRRGHGKAREIEERTLRSRFGMRRDRIGGCLEASLQLWEIKQMIVLASHDKSASR
jgi:hypothetical protein